MSTTPLLHVCTFSYILTLTAYNFENINISALIF